MRIIRKFGQLKAAQLALVEPRGVANLVDVVVLGGHPEHRDGFDSAAGQLFRRADGGKSFVKRVGRTAKETHLLPAHHRDGAIFQARKILLRLCSGTKNHVLLPQNVGNFASTLGGKRKPLGNGDDRLQFRWVRVEGFKLGKILNEVAV